MDPPLVLLDVELPVRSGRRREIEAPRNVKVNHVRKEEAGPATPARSIRVERAVKPESRQRPSRQSPRFKDQICARVRLAVRFGVRAVANRVYDEVLMRKRRTPWMAITWLLAMGTAFPLLARPAKATRLDVTYYYLPG